jgi:hypothetical protein
MRFVSVGLVITNECLCVNKHIAAALPDFLQQYARVRASWGLIEELTI